LFAAVHPERGTLKSIPTINSLLLLLFSLPFEVGEAESKRFTLDLYGHFVRNL